MADDKIWTAAELERLSPDQRAAIVKSGFVTDPSQVPPDLLARARRKVDMRIAATDSSSSPTAAAISAVVSCGPGRS